MMHHKNRENVEPENVLSSLVSRASIVLDELQSLMSQIYQIKDADTSKESDDESAKSTCSSGGSSYWWDDSFNSLVSCRHDDSFDDSLSLSCDSLFSSVGEDDYSEISLYDCVDLFSSCSLQFGKPCDPYITLMSHVISRLAPSNRYDAKRAKQRRKKRMMRKVHPELRRMWTHATALVSPMPKQCPPSPMPTVDWTKVNKRFLTNIPSPTLIPVQSCSEDAQFYEAKVDSFGMRCGSSFHKTNPFGEVWLCHLPRRH